MALVTTIRWRPYPEQKPDDGDFHPVRYSPNGNDDFPRLYHNRFRDGSFACIDADGSYPLWRGFKVLGFALPEDITTTEESP